MTQSLVKIKILFYVCKRTSTYWSYFNYNQNPRWMEFFYLNIIGKILEWPLPTKKECIFNLVRESPLVIMRILSRMFKYFINIYIYIYFFFKGKIHITQRGFFTLFLLNLRANYGFGN